MSHFDCVVREVFENSYLEEQYELVKDEFLKLLDCQKDENSLYEIAARRMINRAVDSIPTRDDRVFFSKILVVLCDECLGKREYLRDTQIKLHQTQVNLLMRQEQNK